MSATPRNAIPQSLTPGLVILKEWSSENEGEGGNMLSLYSEHKQGRRVLDPDAQRNNTLGVHLNAVFVTEILGGRWL